MGIATSIAIAILMASVDAWWIGVRLSGSPPISDDDAVEVGPVGGPVSLTQTFNVEHAGFRAVALTLRPADSADQDTSVVLELAEVDADGHAVTHYRIVRRVSEVASGHAVWWRFAPIAGSAGRTYQIKLTVPNVLRERGVFVMTSRNESYRDGILMLDGREAWGDAVLVVDAQDATLGARMRRQWFDHRPPSAFWALLGTILVGMAVWVYSTVWHATTALGNERLLPVSPQPLRRALAVALLGVAVLAAAAGVRRPGRAGEEAGARQLLDHLHTATMRTNMPHLQDAFARETITASGRRWECLLAVPSSRVTWREHVDAPRRLLLSYGMRPDVWRGPGDGAVFRVGLTAEGRYREIKSEWLSPADRTQDRALRGIDLDLSPFVGSSIDVVLNTEPGPAGNAVGDAALWCAPRMAFRE